jgi:hypothetical protein
LASASSNPPSATKQYTTWGKGEENQCANALAAQGLDGARRSGQREPPIQAIFGETVWGGTIDPLPIVCTDGLSRGSATKAAQVYFPVLATQMITEIYFK